MQVTQLATRLEPTPPDESAAAHRREDLRQAFEQLQGHLTATHAERERDLLDALDALQARQVVVRGRLKTLAAGYRKLRYQVEDVASEGGEALPIKVVHENQLLGEAPNNVLANDEVQSQLRGVHQVKLEKDYLQLQYCLLPRHTRAYFNKHLRQVLVYQQIQKYPCVALVVLTHITQHLTVQLNCVQDADKILFRKLQHTAKAAPHFTQHGDSSPERGGSPQADDPLLAKENARLRLELDSLRNMLQDGAGANVQGDEAAVHAEVARLRVENARLVADRNCERDEAIVQGAKSCCSAVDTECELKKLVASGRDCATGRLQVHCALLSKHCMCTLQQLTCEYALPCRHA